MNKKNCKNYEQIRPNLTENLACGSIEALCDLARADYNKIVAKAKNNSMETSSNMEQEPSSPEDGFITVENKRRKLNVDKIFVRSKRTATETPDPALKNSFAPLATQETNQDEENPTPINTKPKLPPPIVIHEKVADHKLFTNYITGLVGKQYHIKHMGERTSVQTYTEKNYRLLVNQLNNINLEFHTYTLKSDKTHAFVLRGLDSAPDTEEIKDELETTHKIPIKQVYKMTTKYRALYLVVTDKTTTLEFLKQSIKYICQTKIYWERHNNTKAMTQCHRCQEWGHATSNCFAVPQCAHCAEDHWTQQCTKKEENKCANCKQVGHKAFSTECPVYVKRLAHIKKAAPTTTPRYVDAPTPAVNAWNTRMTAPPATNLRQQAPPTPTTASTNPEQFPALAPKPRPQVVTQQNNPHTVDNQDASMTNFNLLTNEFQKLNSLVNVEKMLNLVVSLNRELEKTNTNIEKFMVMNNFMSKLSNADF